MVIGHATVRLHHWIYALGVAFITHLALAASVLPQLKHQVVGAEARGEEGIEIGFGLQGDMGFSAKTQISTPAELPPPVAVKQVVSMKKTVVNEPTATSHSDVLVKATPPAAVEEEVSNKVETMEHESAAIVQKVELPQLTAQPSVTEVIPKSQFVNDSAVSSDAKPLVQSQQRLGSGDGEHQSRGGQVGVKQNYFAKLMGHLARYKRYPLASRRMREEGQALLEFKVNRRGEVTSFSLTKSSGSSRLDKAVLDMLQKAQPLPAFPSELLTQQLNIELPISFSLKQ